MKVNISKTGTGEKYFAPTKNRLRNALAIMAAFMFAMMQISGQYMQVSGKKLLDSGGNQVILRGANFHILDVGSVDLNTPATYQWLIDEFSKSGANVIRIPWYTNGKHWRDVQTPGTLDGYVAGGKLSALMDYCMNKGLVVIFDIHDDGFITCQNQWNYFNTTVMNFWKSTNIINLINSHQSKLIINLANEFAYDADWGGSMSTFQTNYSNAIVSLRNLGIKVPIMIDSPDCGVASSSLISVANSIFNADTLGNTMFDVHAYWGDYANTNTLIDSKINEMANSPRCFIFGEVANTQANPDCGELNIEPVYKRVLVDACPVEIGWLAWSWGAGSDCDPTRQMSSTGYFANLTTIGNDIVNNAVYGLKSSSGCQAVMQTGETSQAQSGIVILPNPTNGELTIENGELKINSVEIFDMNGRKMPIPKFSTLDTQSSIKLDISNLPKGTYLLKINNETEKVIKK